MTNYRKSYDEEWNGDELVHKAKISDPGFDEDLSDGYLGGVIGRNRYNMFIVKVLTIVTLQLLVTAVISTIIYTIPAVREFAQGKWVVTVCFIAAIVLLVALFFVQKKWPANVCVVTGFTVVLGCVVGACASCFSVPAILIAFGITVGICVIIICIALFSKKSFSFLQGRKKEKINNITALKLNSYLFCFFCFFFSCPTAVLHAYYDDSCYGPYRVELPWDCHLVPPCLPFFM